MVEAVKLSGRYSLEGLIAHGGMGRVYTAVDERLHRRVAVKLLKDELAPQPDFVERFRREARAVAALSHPNIAAVYDYGEDAGVPYIVMELLEGRDLARLLRQEGALAPERARHVAAQLCVALGHAHTSGIVHRDVKPANVIVAEDDHVKVTDFGIARVVDQTTLTATGALLGTAQYLSPEQASGGPVGPQSDVYSAGIVLYEMLTGAPPFHGDTPVAVAMRHLSEDVTPPSRTRPDVPQDLDDAVLRATRKEPGQRFASGAEMAAALRGRGSSRAAGAATALLAPPATETPTAALADERRPSFLGKAIGIAAVVVVLLVGGLLAATWVADRQGDAGRRSPTAARRENNPATQAQKVAVPSGLVDSNVKEAEDVLKQHGLESEKRDVPSDKPKDIVVDTQPDEGTEVPEGSTVVLFVSEGPPDEKEDDDEGPPEDGDPPEEEDGGDEGPGKSDEPPGKSKGKGKGGEEDEDD